MPVLCVNMRDDFVGLYRRSRKLLSHVTGSDFPLNEIPKRELASIIHSNRLALARIPIWVEIKTLQRSLFNYGLGPRTLPHINATVDSSCTYADLLVYYAKRLHGPLKYLELGVSVGKTFWQMLCNSGGGRLVGFDIEEMNPVLEQQLTFKERWEWLTRTGSIKKTASSCATYAHAESKSEVSYICGDILDETAWQALKGSTFNLILSDAFHSAEALQKEWEMMTSLNLFDPQQCVVVWDDLNGAMHDWFLKQRREIAAVLGVAPARVRTVFVNGWMGKHESPHRVGVAVKGI